MIYKFKAPIGFFIGLILVVIFFIITIFRIDFPDSLIYPLVLFSLWFSTISRYSCRVIINDSEIIVKYLGFLHSDKVINLKDYKIDYVRKNYWSFDTNHDTETFRGHIFYDTITFIDEKGKRDSVKLNMRFGQFNKLLRKLNYD